jgi:CO/xanthine dehydrogenase Mo-binding subunit
LRFSRRDVIRLGTIAGINVSLGSLALPSSAATFDDALKQVANQPVRRRIDGMGKVTGQKLFARDVRAADVAGWPKAQGHALILRIGRADRPYMGLDLSSLAAEAQPDRIIAAEDLARDGIDFPPFYTQNMLLPAGMTAPILGQAVAILVFSSYERFRAAKSALQFREDIFRFGDPEPQPDLDPWGVFRSVRVENPDGEDAFSSYRDQPLHPIGFSGGQPVWPAPRADGGALERGIFHAEAIGAALNAPKPGRLVMSRQYSTQSADAVALETESANCWYDPLDQVLHMVVAVQNPAEALSGTAHMLGASNLKVREIRLYPCMTVSYGSKDNANHTYYAAVAALYGTGQPIRTVLDRYEHFQAALKRHPYEMDYTLAVDRETGRFEALRSRITANGGGRPSFSNVVVQESTAQSTGIYDFPKSDLQGIAARTRALDASAIRGFGNLQAMCGLEMMVDELAAEIGVDAIELRLRNAMRTGMRSAQGGMPTGALRITEVLERARQHPLWTERAQRKLAFEQANPSLLFGIGFACAQKNFGSGAEAAFAKVEITQDGAISVRHCGVETGTGLATTQAAVCAEWLGRDASSVLTGVTDWSDLPIEVTGDTFSNTQEFEDQARRNPLWSPRYVSSSGATNTAYYFTHATRQAARIVASFGIWPSAVALWKGRGTLPSGIEATHWVNGELTAAGLPPLSWQMLVETAYGMGGVTGVTVHAFNRWQWAEADYPIGDGSARLPLDGVSVRYGHSPYKRSERRNVAYPPVQRNRGGATLTSTVATLVALSVDKASGEAIVQDVHTILECGRVMMPQLVAGQLHGANAMGIGHALYESLPLYEDGPGSGDWNLDRYRLPRAAEVAVWRQSIDILPPLNEGDPPKGFAEAAVIPVAPAIGNAVAHATGKRLNVFPMTAEKIKERLL